jgi:hypothetical protein
MNRQHLAVVASMPPNETVGTGIMRRCVICLLLATGCSDQQPDPALVASPEFPDPWDCSLGCAMGWVSYATKNIKIDHASYYPEPGDKIEFLLEDSLYGEVSFWGVSCLGEYAELSIDVHINDSLHQEDLVFDDPDKQSLMLDQSIDVAGGDKISIIINSRSEGARLWSLQPDGAH